MIIDYIFVTPNMYESGEVLPKDCKKEIIDLGAVPNEVCDIYGTPYDEYISEVIPEPTPEQWLFGEATPIVYA